MAFMIEKVDATFVRVPGYCVYRNNEHICMKKRNKKRIYHNCRICRICNIPSANIDEVRYIRREPKLSIKHKPNLGVDDL